MPEMNYTSPERFLEVDGPRFIDIVARLNYYRREGRANGIVYRDRKDRDIAFIEDGGGRAGYPIRYFVHPEIAGYAVFS